jgi:hypothetical protein
MKIKIKINEQKDISNHIFGSVGVAQCRWAKCLHVAATEGFGVGGQLFDKIGAIQCRRRTRTT